MDRWGVPLGVATDGAGVHEVNLAPVALADVVKAAGKHKLVKYKITHTHDRRLPPGVFGPGQ